MSKGKLTPEMQAAAVREALQHNGNNLDQVEQRYPELEEGVAIVRRERQKPPPRRGSGSTQRHVTRVSRPVSF